MRNVEWTSISILSFLAPSSLVSASRSNVLEVGAQLTRLTRHTRIKLLLTAVTLTFVKSAQAARSPAGTPTDAEAHCEANADLCLEPATLCSPDRI
jgi:hypothetical protein